MGVFTSVQFREFLGLISDLAVKLTMSSEMDYFSFAAALLDLVDFRRVNTQRARLLAAA